jgi:hypothetical protein
MERTLIIVKPDAVQRGLIGNLNLPGRKAPGTACRLRVVVQSVFREAILLPEPREGRMPFRPAGSRKGTRRLAGRVMAHAL